MEQKQTPSTNTSPNRETKEANLSELQPVPVTSPIAPGQPKEPKNEEFSPELTEKLVEFQRRFSQFLAGEYSLQVSNFVDNATYHLKQNDTVRFIGMLSSKDLLGGVAANKTEKQAIVAHSVSFMRKELASYHSRIYKKPPVSAKTNAGEDQATLPAIPQHVEEPNKNAEIRIHEPVVPRMPTVSRKKPAADLGVITGSGIGLPEDKKTEAQIKADSGNSKQASPFITALNTSLVNLPVSREVFDILFAASRRGWDGFTVYHLLKRTNHQLRDADGLAAFHKQEVRKALEKLSPGLGILFDSVTTLQLSPNGLAAIRGLLNDLHPNIFKLLSFEKRQLEERHVPRADIKVIFQALSKVKR